MDKKIAGLIGAVTALSAGGAMAAAPVTGGMSSARSFAELLQPIPDASARLAAADAASAAARKVQLAQYYERRERDDVPPIVRDLVEPRYDHHHHHHHHHHDYYERDR